MRKISTFSAKLQGVESNGSRTTFARKPTQGEPNGEVTVFMTPSMLKMEIRDMKRSINIRFLQFIKSCKAYAKSTKDPEDLMYLKRLMVEKLTTMLSEYVNMLQTNPSLQLATYLKISSVAPQAMDSARTLSRVMIMANRVRKSNGVLPPKNQRDLNRTMDAFMTDVIDICTNATMVRQAVINKPTE